MASQPPAAREIVIKATTEGELGEWVRAMEAGFLLAAPDEAIAYRRAFFTPGRSFGAFAGDTCVATLRSLDLEVTAPGGTAVSAEGITNVAVVPARRRRGLLTTLMRLALDEAVVRGHCLAALIASEYRIYGRFGFGTATTTAAYDIEVRRAGDVRVFDGAEGTFEELSLEEARRHGAELHERFRRIQPGAINRSELVWRLRTGELRNPYRDRHQPWAVLYRDAHGTPAGMALYRVDERWSGGDPDYEMTVDDLFAVDSGAADALWRHLLGTEWVNRVTVVGVAPDDPLPGSARHEDSGAFVESRLLIGPVVERCRGHNDIEGCAGIRQVLGHADGIVHAGVVRGIGCDLDHGRRWIDAVELVDVGEALRQRAKEMPRATADVEQAAGKGIRRKDKIGCSIGNLMVHATAPAFLVRGGTGFEGVEVTFGRHERKVWHRNRPWGHGGGHRFIQYAEVGQAQSRGGVRSW